MSFPYITDLLNAILGVQWSAPIPTFGVVVALAILIATGVARAEARRLEAVGRLHRSAHLMVGDLALVSVLAGLVGARVFDILDHVGQFMADPIGSVKRIYRHFDQDLSAEGEERMRAWHEAHPQGKHGQHQLDKFNEWCGLFL